MACEKNIDEVVGSTPSIASGTDWVLFRSSDGTWLVRQWSNWISTSPEDLELDVVASGGDLGSKTVDNGSTELTIPEHAGWRTRFYRNGMPQGKSPGKPTYYSYDIQTGKYIFTPALNTGEFLIFQTY